MGTDNLHHKRKAERLARKSTGRSEAPRILIFTEGYSEKIYLDGLKSYLQLGKHQIQIEKSKHTDCIGILEEAHKVAKSEYTNGNEFTHLFIVFDLDTVQPEKAKIAQSLFPKIKKFSKALNAKIFPIMHYPCVEVWFIFHFKSIDRPFCAKGVMSIGEAAKQELKELWQEYHETNPDIFCHLYKKQNNNIDKLIERSKSHLLQQHSAKTYNPATSFHELVSFLNDISKKKYEYAHSNTLENLFFENQD